MTNNNNNNINKLIKEEILQQIEDRINNHSINNNNNNNNRGNRTEKIGIVHGQDNTMQALIDSVKQVMSSHPNDTLYFKELLTVPGLVLVIPARRVGSDQLFVAAYIDYSKRTMGLDGHDEAARPVVWPYLSQNIPMEYFRHIYPTGDKNMPVSSVLDEIEDAKIATNINNVVRKHAVSLLNRVNVSLVTSKRYNGKPIIFVYVRHAGLLPFFDTPIESSLDGFDVVVKEGYINLNVGNDECMKHTRPLKVGLSIGCSGDLSIENHNTYSGTIAKFYQFNNDIFILTAGHILPTGSTECIKLTQPPKMSDMIEDRHLISASVVDLSTYKFTNQDHRRVTIDAALFKIRDNVVVDRSSLCISNDTWEMFTTHPDHQDWNLRRTIRSCTNVPQLVDDCEDIKNITDWRWVFKIGFKTGITVGHVSKSDSHMKMIEIENKQLKQVFLYYNQLSVIPTTASNTTFSEAGDSGALVWILNEGGQAMPLGMVVAGSYPLDCAPSTTITPLKDIEELIYQKMNIKNK